MYKLGDLISGLIVSANFFLEYFDFNTTSESQQHRYKIVLSWSWPLKRLLTKCPQSTQETGDSTLTVFIKQHTLVHKTKHYGKPVYLNYGTWHTGCSQGNINVG